jgi:myo-inositol 2-dehydrogenase/D-chiro-inositol 1-dehydrogenase
MKQNRREFMKSNLKAGALVALPMIFPRGVFAGANERIGIGLIGMGRQALFANLKPLLNSEHTQVLAVCDVDRWRLDRAKKEVEQFYSGKSGQESTEVCAAYEDFRELLAREDIDAVMVSTPDHWHVPISLMAVESGKDVCCEKPLTLSIAEGRVLSDAVTKHQRVFRTDSEFRSIPDMHRAVELVRNGRIGRIHTIRTGVPGTDVGCEPQPEMPVPEELNYEMWLGPAPQKPYTLLRVHPREDYSRPGWMRVRDTCEGMITNWGAHLNAIAQWGNGTDRTGPVSVEGRGSYPKEKGLWNVLIDFHVEYEYADGTRLIYETDYPYVRFEGDEGWIMVEYGKKGIKAEPESVLQSEIKDDEIRFPLKSEKQDFIDSVLSRGQTLADAEVGHRTTSLCQIGHIAIQIGRMLEWDPELEKFNDEEANTLLTREMREPWSILG